MPAPYWTMPVLLGHHTSSIIHLKLRWFKEEQHVFHNNYDWNSSVTDIKYCNICNYNIEEIANFTMYKIINNLECKLIYQKSYLHLKNRGHPPRLMQLQTTLTFINISFLPHAIRIWNSLPTDVVLSATHDDFKGNLNKITVTAFLYSYTKF